MVFEVFPIHIRLLYKYELTMLLQRQPSHVSHEYQNHIADHLPLIALQNNYALQCSIYLLDHSHVSMVSYKALQMTSMPKSYPSQVQEVYFLEFQTTSYSVHFQKSLVYILSLLQYFHRSSYPTILDQDLHAYNKALHFLV